MINKLNWDSEFFGFQVGQIYLEVEPDWEKFIPLFIQNASEFKLVYFITSENFLVPDHILQSINGRFVNQKVLYQKQLRKTKNIIPKYISEFKDTNLQNDFIELAYLSGYYSRFNLDSNFPHGKFEELYETWIRRSLDKFLADKVYIAKRNGKIKAMVTCKYEGSLCKIGLLAVDRSEQGRGTGRFLIQMVENQAYDRGLKNIQIPTQSNNVIACRFYEKQGFSAIETTNYYHLWIP